MKCIKKSENTFKMWKNIQKCRFSSKSVKTPINGKCPLTRSCDITLSSSNSETNPYESQYSLCTEIRECDWSIESKYIYNDVSHKNGLKKM